MSMASVGVTGSRTGTGRRHGLPFLLLLLAGCGATADGRRWGEDVSLGSGTDRAEDSILSAALDPLTIIPAAGAAIFLLGDNDQRATHWASKHGPLCGSENGADSAGDLMLGACIAAWAATSAATPSGDETGEWLANKGKGYAVGAAALLATQGATDVLKSTTGRERPTGRGTGSFPSGHASMAASGSTLAVRNLRWLKMPAATRTVLSAGFYGLAALTAWSRVEANDHHPSDVLAGLALGHFVSVFVNDALLPFELDVGPAADGTGVVAGIRIPF